MSSQKNKRINIKMKIIILTLLMISIIPIKNTYKDGGTVSYNAILYSYVKYHRIQSDDTYYIKNVLRIFPFNFLSE